MYCSIDKVDLAARVDGRPVAIQTDHRAAEEIEAEPELSGLYAMARILNARGHLAEQGHPDAAVCYVVPGEVPELLRAAVRAAGATIERVAAGTLPPLAAGTASTEEISALANTWFAGLARRAAARIGTRDLAMALRMLEDQTVADPPDREDERRYWDRVLELAALTGELLRAKYPGAGWVPTDRAVVPFGLQLAGEQVTFPTNRAQRVIEDGADESLFKLLVAADDVLRPDGASSRLMPSLRAREGVELDEVVWRAIIDGEAAAQLPIVVCGIDGANTFGMIRREALGRPADEAMREALANLAAEPVQIERIDADDLALAVVSGSFYAAEKVLDPALMQRLHDELASPLLAAAAPARGVLLVASAASLTAFAELVAARHAGAGGRAISPAVLLVSDGCVVGFVGAS